MRSTSPLDTKRAAALLRPGRGASLAGLLAALAVIAPASALASDPAEEREGARILRGIEDGGRDCGTLETGDYERIGEYGMGRMVGSPTAHASMDRLMARMMGERTEEQMHVLMGRRFSGCASVRATGGLGGMMGMMGMMGGGFGPGGGRGPPDEGGGPGAAGFPGMMDRDRFVDENGDNWGAAGIVMTVVMLLFVALAVAALLVWRPWRQAGRGKSSLEILQERFAHGEIDADEYAQRRDVLGGGR